MAENSLASAGIKVKGCPETGPLVGIRALLCKGTEIFILVKILHLSFKTVFYMVKSIEAEFYMEGMQMYGNQCAEFCIKGM